MIGSILGVCSALSSLLNLWQWIAASRFPLHQRSNSPGFDRWPGITIFKPLKGADQKTTECLSSWMTQDYPGQIQVLFGVASLEDPACAVVRQLQEQFPNVQSSLVHCPELLGPNAKVSSLAQMLPSATGDWILVSDSDVWAPGDLLRQLIIQASGREQVLISCFYRLSGRETAAMRWESFAVNSDFWSQVLQSRDLKPIDFALGAVMMLSRSQLDKIGGFLPITQYLADDYQLGNRVVGNGGLVEISPIVVECRGGPQTWSAAWSHQLRWARTIRICQPVPFFFSILNDTSIWPLAWCVAAPSGTVFSIAAVMLLLRAFSGLSHESRLRKGPIHGSQFWRVWFKDVMHLAVWVGAFCGRTVVWRGKVFQVFRDGRMAPLE